MMRDEKYESHYIAGTDGKVKSIVGRVVAVNICMNFLGFLVKKQLAYMYCNTKKYPYVYNYNTGGNITCILSMFSYFY